MVLFLFALVVAAVGVAAYGHYNPGVQDITLRTYRLTGVANWMVVAAAAAVPLFLFLLHAMYASARFRRLRRAVERQAGEPSRYSGPQQGPKRSWHTSGD